VLLVAACIFLFFCGWCLISGIEVKIKVAGSHSMPPMVWMIFERMNDAITAIHWFSSCIVGEWTDWIFVA